MPGGVYATFDITGPHPALSNAKQYTGQPWGPSEYSGIRLLPMLLIRDGRCCRLVSDFTIFPPSREWLRWRLEVVTDAFFWSRLAVAMGTRISGSFMQTFPPEDS